VPWWCHHNATEGGTTVPGSVVTGKTHRNVGHRPREGDPTREHGRADWTARVVRYRTRATVARAWAGWLGVVVLVGLLGGVAMAGVAAGRRTQGSYPTFLASTNPSDLTASVYSPVSGNALPSILPVLAADRALVRTVRELEVPHVAPIAPNGGPELTKLSDVNFVASLDGEFTHQDRITIVSGHSANPRDASQLVMDANAARIFGVHVGSVMKLGMYSPAERAAVQHGAKLNLPASQMVKARVVGLAVLNNAVVQDDIDRAYGTVFVTPALLREDARIDPTTLAPIQYALQLTNGARGVLAAEQLVDRHLPSGATVEFHVASRVVTQDELALRPESVAIGAFGAIAALACLLLALQAITRLLREGDRDRVILRALGATRRTIAADGLPGVLLAVVAGALVAAAVAIALSPLAPFGPVRAVYPDRGIAADWTVLLGGIALLVVVLGAGAIGWSARQATARPGRRRAPRPSSVARAAEAAGLPATCVVGVRFALESGSGRTSVPLRSTLVGTAVAVTLVVATLTFASSFQTLISHPALYGWNWTYALAPTNNVPPQALKLFDRDPDVASWSGYDYNNVNIDGETVPVLMAIKPGERVGPPILSGHGLQAAHQIVIGASTLAVLHKRVGDTVLVSWGSPNDAPLYLPPTKLKVVGTTTLPAIGYESLVADHTSMGTGAMFPETIFPASFARAVGNPDPVLSGPELVFVRLRAGIGAAAGRHDMARIAAFADRLFARDPYAAGNDVLPLGVQRPAQIVNYRSIASAPVVLAVALALGALIALALTLVASVRRRRFDLALLKALGFTPRQLGASVAWQATVAAAIGVVVGLPLGVVLGRQLWLLFARGLNAVPVPTVPVGYVVLVAVGALLFANVVAAIPGRSAARTPTAALLRAD
jgi:hypothetical protein